MFEIDNIHYVSFRCWSEYSNFSFWFLRFIMFNLPVQSQFSHKSSENDTSQFFHLHRFQFVDPTQQQHHQHHQGVSMCSKFRSKSSMFYCGPHDSLDYRLIHSSISEFWSPHQPCRRFENPDWVYKVPNLQYKFSYCVLHLPFQQLLRFPGVILIHHFECVRYLTLANQVFHGCARSHDLFFDFLEYNAFDVCASLFTEILPSFASLDELFLSIQFGKFSINHFDAPWMIYKVHKVTCGNWTFLFDTIIYFIQTAYCHIRIFRWLVQFGKFYLMIPRL